MDPFISVIIPSHGRPQNLRRALTSLLLQAYHFFEIIVVDDNGLGSLNQRETAAVFFDFQKMSKLSMKYLINEKNSGGSFSRNKGIQAASGAIISFLDDDDFYLSYFLEDIAVSFEDQWSSEHPYLMFFSSTIVTRDMRFAEAHVAKIDDDPVFNLLCGKSFFYTGSNMAFTKEVFSLLLFDESFARHQDLEFVIRFLKIHSSKIIPISRFGVCKCDEPFRKPVDGRLLYQSNVMFFATFSTIISSYPDNKQKIIYRSNNLEVYYSSLFFHEKDISDKMMSLLPKEDTSFSFSKKLRSLSKRSRILRFFVFSIKQRKVHHSIGQDLWKELLFLRSVV